MRDIRFRAWDKKEKIMYCNTDKHTVWGGGIEACVTGEDCQHKNIPYENIMQFTGLKDKNGKEIYESDLVMVTDLPDEDFNGVFKVIWDSPMFRLVREVSLGKHFIPMNYTMEVIGNLYENPKLLES